MAVAVLVATGASWSSWWSLLVVVVGGLFVGMPALRSFAAGMAEGNTSAINYPFIGGLVKDELGASLSTPAGTDTTVVPITVASGETVKQIAADLANNKLIARPLVFQYLVASEGAGDKIQTGLFNLNQTMTPQAIVDRMQKTPDPKNPLVAVALRGGLAARAGRCVSPDARLVDERERLVPGGAQSARPVADRLSLAVGAARRQEPGGLPRARGVLRSGPTSPPDALMRLLLDQWQKDVGQSVIDQATAKHEKFYDVLKLASIVEKETPVDSERVKVAGVYTNRLNGILGNSLLNSEPTVIYANDTMQLRRAGLQ